MKDYKGKQKSASSMLKGCSYAKGGKVHKPKVSDSEVKQEKKAKKEVGGAEGKDSAPRLDKLKRGGKAHKKAKTNVNVIVAPGKKDVPMPVPVPAATQLPPGPSALPPMGAKKGGKVKKRAAGGRVPQMTGGAGGGKGRLEKSKDASKED